MEALEREMIAVFSHPGFQRLWGAAEQKWLTHGRFAGQVQIEKLTVEESQKVSGLIGALFLPEERATIRLSILEKKLLDSRWEVSLETLLPLVTGRPLVSKKQRRLLKGSAWDSFCQQVLAGCRREESKLWWEGVWAGKAIGSRAVRSSFEEDRVCALSCAQLTVRAFDELPCWKGATERLPVWANRLSGDPHAFDADQLAGRWLYQALCSMWLLPAESASEWKREVWLEAGILLDEVLSFVTAVGLQTVREDPWRAFFSTAYEARMPMLLPLVFFQEKVGWNVSGRLFVVENPAVFQHLLDCWPEGRELPALVCTSGQPSVAALRLFDAVWRLGNEIWYSGDFDWKGIEMACSLQKRYGEQFVAWRMGFVEYESVELGVPFEQEQLEVLAQMGVPWDEQLIAALLRRRMKVFQESLVSLLLDDLLKWAYGESCGNRRSGELN